MILSSDVVAPFDAVGCIMQNTDAEWEPCVQILRLLDKQIDIVDRSLFVPLSDEEEREYEARKLRIYELTERLR